MIEKYFTIGRCRFLVETILTLNKNMSILIPGNVHQWCSQGLTKEIKTCSEKNEKGKPTKYQYSDGGVAYDVIPSSLFPENSSPFTPYLPYFLIKHI